MNWIIRNTSKLKYHTNLNVLLEPIKEDIKKFKWLIADLEINSTELEQLPINHSKDWFLINSSQMEQIRQSDAQIIWGAFSAIDMNEDIEINSDNLPLAEGVDKIWRNENLQVEKSEIEIIAWDSSYTIIKFIDEKLSEKFKAYFEEAIELEKFKTK